MTHRLPRLWANGKHLKYDCLHRPRSGGFAMKGESVGANWLLAYLSHVFASVFLRKLKLDNTRNDADDDHVNTG